MQTQIEFSRSTIAGITNINVRVSSTASIVVYLTTYSPPLRLSLHLMHQQPPATLYLTAPLPWKEQEEELPFKSTPMR
jgi:hypothetical protein